MLFTIGTQTYNKVDSSVDWNGAKLAVGVTTTNDRAGIIRLTSNGVANPIELMPLETGKTKSSNLQLAVSGDVCVASWTEENISGGVRHSRAKIWRRSTGEFLTNAFKITQGTKDQFGCKPIMLPNGTIAFLSAQGDLGDHGFRVDVFDTSGVHQKSTTLPAPSFKQIISQTDMIDGFVIGNNLYVTLEDIYSSPATGREIVLRALNYSDLSVVPVDKQLNANAAGDHLQVDALSLNFVGLAGYVEDASMAGGSGGNGKDVLLRVIRADSSLGSEQILAGGPGDQYDVHLAENGKQLVGSYIDNQTNKLFLREINHEIDGSISSIGSAIDLSENVVLKFDGGQAIAFMGNNRLAVFLDTNGQLHLNSASVAPSPTTTPSNPLPTSTTAPITSLPSLTTASTSTTNKSTTKISISNSVSTADNSASSYTDSVASSTDSTDKTTDQFLSKMLSSMIPTTDGNTDKITTSTTNSLLTSLAFNPAPAATVSNTPMAALPVGSPTLSGNPTTTILLAIFIPLAICISLLCGAGFYKHKKKKSKNDEKLKTSSSNSKTDNNRSHSSSELQRLPAVQYDKVPNQSTYDKVKTTDSTNYDKITSANKSNGQYIEADAPWPNEDDNDNDNVNGNDNDNDNDSDHKKDNTTYAKPDSSFDF